MTGTPEDSTESGFMEKPGIEHATPGLQDIGLSPKPRRLHLYGMGAKKDLIETFFEYPQLFWFILKKKIFNYTLLSGGLLKVTI